MTFYRASKLFYITNTLLHVNNMKVSTIAIVLCATVCFNSLTAQATQISYHVAVDKETTGQDLTKMQKNNPAVTNIDEAPVSSPGAKRLLHGDDLDFHCSLFLDSATCAAQSFFCIWGGQ